METAVKEGKYIYCIINANPTPQAFGPLGIGGRGDELYAVCFNDLAAVVSNSPIKKYSIARENMIPHEQAIEEVMKTHTVLPVRFCTITEDEEKVKKILEREHDKFLDLLKNMEGKKELGLKAIFSAKGGPSGGSWSSAGKADVYKDILEKYKDIRALKEKLAGLSPEKAYYQHMAIGKMVENALQREKDICKDEILNALSPLAQEVKINSTYGELMILSAAFLVEKHKEAEFDQKVNELGAKYGDKIKFKYVGTLPPFNFVNVVISTEDL